MNTNKSSPKNKITDKQESASALDEQIRRRAYDLYQQRGREDGRDTDDWLQAEAELAREKSQSRAARPVKKSRKAPSTVTASGRAKPIKKSSLPASSKTFVD
jgi:hypothetical protein